MIMCWCKCTDFTPIPVFLNRCAVEFFRCVPKYLNTLPNPSIFNIFIILVLFHTLVKIFSTKEFASSLKKV